MLFRNNGFYLGAARRNRPEASIRASHASVPADAEDCAMTQTSTDCSRHSSIAFKNSVELAYEPVEEPTEASPYVPKKTVTVGDALELKRIPGGEIVNPYSPFRGVTVTMRESPTTRGNPLSDSIDPVGKSICRKVVLKLSECSIRSTDRRVLAIQKLCGVASGAPAVNSSASRSASDLLVSAGNTKSEQEVTNNVMSTVAAIPRLRDIGRQ